MDEHYKQRRLLRYQNSYNDLDVKIMEEEFEEEKNILLDHIRYLLPANERMFPEHIPEGLPAIFYHTLTYEGDLKISDKLKQIRKSITQDKERQDDS